MSVNTQEAGKQQGTSGGSGGSTSEGAATKMQPTSNGENNIEQTKPEERSEGMVARTIEQQTAKLPSDLFLWAAIGGMGISAVLELTGFKDKSRFFGQWVAPFLLFGVYNKLVKQHGSDETERTA